MGYEPSRVRAGREGKGREGKGRIKGDALALALLLLLLFWLDLREFLLRELTRILFFLCV